MQHRVIRRAAGAALVVLLLTAVAVFADIAPASDTVTPGTTVVDLPTSFTGQVVTRSVDLRLTCDTASIRHAARGVTIQLDGIGTKEEDGEIDVTGTTITVPDDWPLDRTVCPSPTPTALSNAPSVVTMKMPTVPSTAGPYIFTVMWSRSPSTNITKLSTITYRVNVVLNTPPALTVPADTTAEATSAAGAVVSFSATATDREDTPPPTPSCIPASGSTFPLGDTTVECTVTDRGGMKDSGSFHVFVGDTTAPTLVGMPPDRTIRTNDPGGATLTYASPTATDAVDASPTVVCSPPSGEPIPLGLTPVTCTATDDAGNPASDTFDVNVVLNAAPVLTVPADKTAEATSAAGAAVSFTATATDAEDGTATPTCTPASGSTFGLGTTTVDCRVTDSEGRSDSGSFAVTVRDTTAPTLVGVPADITLTTSNSSGATLTYTKPGANDAVDPSPSVSCSRASGETIPLGTTIVTCTATDRAGNHSSASFQATVSLTSSTVWSAVWGEPLAVGDVPFLVNGNRSVPIKVEIFANGVEQTTGNGVLSVVGCAGGTPVDVALAFENGRWNGKLETSRLPGPGCYRATVSLDGHAAGSFRLDLKGLEPTKGSANAVKAGTKP